MSKSKKQPSNDFDPFASSFTSFPSFADFSDEPQQDTSNYESYEEEAKAEVTDYQLAIREASAKTRKSLEDQWNTDYYFCAFFANQAQRDQFLQKAGALGLIKDNFINGQKLAELLGIDIEPQQIETPKLFAPKKDWFDITM